MTLSIKSIRLLPILASLVLAACSQPADQPAAPPEAAPAPVATEAPAEPLPATPEAAAPMNVTPPDVPTTSSIALTPPLPADAEKVVNVYMWSEYIDPELLDEFKRRTGIEVRLSVYEATEEMMAKLQQAGGASQYDVIVSADHSIPVMAKLGLIQPLHPGMIPNMKNLMDRFVNPAFDPENKYSIAYQWGTMGLIYRKDQVPNMEPTWAMVLDPSRQPGPVVLIDSMRDMLAAALKYQGRSINTKDPAELKAAGDLILAAKKSSKTLGFEGGVGGKNKVAAGDAAVAIVYNGDALRAAAEDDQLAYLIPAEGTLIWVDCMMIPSEAPHPSNAHEFINFILDPEIGAKLSDFNQYATPNSASLALVDEADRNNPGIYPPEEELAKMEYLEDIGDATQLYDSTWTMIKSR